LNITIVSYNGSLDIGRVQKAMPDLRQFAKHMQDAYKELRPHGVRSIDEKNGNDEFNAVPQAPGPFLLALEAAPWEFGASLAAFPVMRFAPRGDGHSVVVFPGLAASDVSTLPLRAFLSSAATSRGWDLRFNLGPREGVLERSLERVPHPPRYGPQGEPARMEPGRGVCARDREAGARGRALRDHPGLALHRPSQGEQRLAHLRARQRPFAGRRRAA
jgi:hypothetical protein